MATVRSWAFYERHFGTARLQHYLASTDGDHDSAMELYRWNVAISGAFWQSLAYFEGALRNALDERMVQRHTTRGRTGHWVYDDARELGRDADGPGRHRQPYTDISRAKHRVRTQGKTMSPGQIISEVPFGFWHQMLSRKQTFLWPDLADAFPHAPNRAQPTVQQPVERLRAVRNRIGHHHRVWSEDVEGRHADLADVAGFMDPKLRAFILERSLVTRLIRTRPGVGSW